MRGAAVLGCSRLRTRELRPNFTQVSLAGPAAPGDGRTPHISYDKIDFVAPPLPRTPHRRRDDAAIAIVSGGGVAEGNDIFVVENVRDVYCEIPGLPLII